MRTHSSILARRIPWTEEPGGLWSMGSQSQTQLSDWVHLHLSPEKWLPASFTAVPPQSPAQCLELRNYSVPGDWMNEKGGTCPREGLSQTSKLFSWRSTQHPGGGRLRFEMRPLWHESGWRGPSLVVQWLRLHTPNAGGPGSIPSRGTGSLMPQLRPSEAR